MQAGKFARAHMVASTPIGEQRPTRSLTQVRAALLNAAIDPGSQRNAVALVARESPQQKPHDKKQPVHHSPGGNQQESVASRTGRQMRSGEPTLRKAHLAATLP
jgi:hypothetical protein